MAIGTKHQELKLLAAPVPLEDIEWKPGPYNERNGTCLAMPYMTNRFPMERLDFVVGPERWQDQYIQSPLAGCRSERWDKKESKWIESTHYAIQCGIGIYFEGTSNGGWVWKWDAAEPTDMEPVKGGYSDAMKRAAVKWGIGRSLYYLPKFHVPAWKGQHGHGIDFDRFDPEKEFRTRKDCAWYMRELEQAKSELRELFARASVVVVKPEEPQVQDKPKEQEKPQPQKVNNEVKSEKEDPNQKNGNDDDNPFNGITGRRTGARVAQSVAAKTKEDNPPEKAPEVLGNGILRLKQGSSPSRKASEILKDFSELMKIWGDEKGDLEKLYEILEALNEDGYEVTKEGYRTRACWSKPLSDDKVKIEAHKPSTKGRYVGKNPLEIAKIDPEFMENVARIDDAFGQIARYCLAQVKSAGATEKKKEDDADKTTDDVSAAAKARIAKAKSSKPVDPKREARKKMILEAFQKAGKSVDESDLESFADASMSVKDGEPMNKFLEVLVSD